MKNNSYQRGFMQIVFLAVVIIAGLAYFNVDLHALAQTPAAQKIIVVLSSAWTDYLFPMLKFLRENVINILNSAGTMATSTATSTIPVAN